MHTYPELILHIWAQVIIWNKRQNKYSVQLWKYSKGNKVKFWKNIIFCGCSSDYWYLIIYLLFIHNNLLIFILEVPFVELSNKHECKHIPETLISSVLTSYLFETWTNRITEMLITCLQSKIPCVFCSAN